MTKSKQAPLLSYDHGTSSQRLLGATLGHHFLEVSSSRDKADALIDVGSNQRFSYKQLQEKVNLTARGLLAMGVQTGDRVGIWSTNNAEWLIT
ncbi:MAG TPA: AMP-binding protein, partial [Candidatus Obscuribacterales bacterium]|nr:AMP-binding protein [Candidatus Obscuribacterales bacterium]